MKIPLSLSAAPPEYTVSNAYQDITNICERLDTLEKNILTLVEGLGLALAEIRRLRGHVKQDDE
jgi:hypothetical protein